MPEGIGDLLGNNPLVMQDQHPEMEMPKLEENKSLWRGFMDKIQGDPNMRMTLMAMGANMLKSPGFGQNGWDVTGNAVAQGLTQFQQGRQMEAQNALAGREQTRKETDSTAGNAVAAQNAATYGTAVGTQGKVADASIANNATETSIKQQNANLNAELAPREIAAKETAAAADMKRADAYTVASKTAAAGGGSTGQNVQLVNQRKSALMAMNPDLSEEEATLTAQNDILLSKSGGSNPASIASKSFETMMKAWQGNVNNIGKNPSSQEVEQMRQDSINWAKTLSKMNQKPATTSTSGVINRSGDPALGGEMPGSAPPEPESVVGRKVQGKNGGFAEIVGQDGNNVSIRLPNGKVVTQPLEAVSPHIIAE